VNRLKYRALTGIFRKTKRGRHSMSMTDADRLDMITRNYRHAMPVSICKPRYIYRSTSNDLKGYTKENGLISSAKALPSNMISCPLITLPLACSRLPHEVVSNYLLVAPSILPALVPNLGSNDLRGIAIAGRRRVRL